MFSDYLVIIQTKFLKNYPKYVNVYEENIPKVMANS